MKASDLKRTLWNIFTSNHTICSLVTFILYKTTTNSHYLVRWGYLGLWVGGWCYISALYYLGRRSLRYKPKEFTEKDISDFCQNTNVLKEGTKNCASVACYIESHFTGYPSWYLQRHHWFTDMGIFLLGYFGSCRYPCTKRSFQEVHTVSDVVETYHSLDEHMVKCAEDLRVHCEHFPVGQRFLIIGFTPLIVGDKGIGHYFCGIKLKDRLLFYDVSGECERDVLLEMTPEGSEEKIPLLERRKWIECWSGFDVVPINGSADGNYPAFRVVRETHFLWMQTLWNYIRAII